MRRSNASSARTVAFVAAFCALAVAAGCGRESFNLVPEPTLDSAAAGHGAGTLEQGGRGGAAAAGKAGGGGGGKAGGGGFGGRSNNSGGGSSNFPCLGEAGCADDVCPPYSTSPFCNGCVYDGDCASNEEAKVCNPDTKRCVECRRTPDCRNNKVCNMATQRCATSCDRNDDCNGDSKQSFCNLEHHVCVACNWEGDCLSYGPNLHCYFSVCVECVEGVEERQCSADKACFGGRCVKR